MVINNFIRTYDNVLSDEICDSLISKFNSLKHYDERDTDYYRFDQVEIQRYKIFKNEFNFTLNAFNSKVLDYLQEFQIKFWPKNAGYEMFRLKKYKKDGYFKEHIDVVGLETNKRFLSFFCYLNNDGGTMFTFQNEKLKIEGKKGRLLIFPPFWMYPHYAEVINEKFLLHTYLHYIE